MLIIGCDYHASVQQIAFVDSETGETGERRLLHENSEAERFYRDLKLRGVSVRVGIEATGHARWFERLLAELGFELWIGDPARLKPQSAEAEDRSSGCAAVAEAAGGRALPTHLDTKSGESGCAPTALASASAGADADTSHESVAGGGDE